MAGRRITATSSPRHQPPGRLSSHVPRRRNSHEAVGPSPWTRAVGSPRGRSRPGCLLGRRRRVPRRGRADRELVHAAPSGHGRPSASGRGARERGGDGRHRDPGEWRGRHEHLPPRGGRRAAPGPPGRARRGSEQRPSPVFRRRRRHARAYQLSGPGPRHIRPARNALPVPERGLRARHGRDAGAGPGRALLRRYPGRLRLPGRLGRAVQAVLRRSERRGPNHDPRGRERAVHRPRGDRHDQPGHLPERAASRPGRSGPRPVGRGAGDGTASSSTPTGAGAAGGGSAKAPAREPS